MTTYVMKYTLNRINNCLDSAEDKNNKIEDITIEIIQMKHRRFLKNEESIILPLKGTLKTVC